MVEHLVAILVGLIQGLLEWLPVSSEGAVAIATTAVAGASPADATRLALFLHAGTALSAIAYYRGTLQDLLFDLPRWRPRTAFGAETADLSFLAVATVATGVTGVPLYLVLSEAVSVLEGGAFVALIGVLLVGTGLLQRYAGAVALGDRSQPNLLDAVLVGGLQGLAILPGVSRSGVTISALLFRRHSSRSAFDYSFLLSIPAALGAGALVVVDHGGLPAIAPTDAVLALGTSAVVGYLTIDALLALVDRIRVWVVCVGLGLLAIAGGTLVIVLV
jgi:undecaprenyl-diphosphatase